MRLVVIGIDDTDMPDTRGTGRLARMLADEIEEAGLGRSAGVTRHQFHVGPGVPMTSHNSSAAIGVETDRPLPDLRQFAVEVMHREFIAGSDPGLALLDAPAPDEVVAFARRAQRELVKRAEAEALVERFDLTACGLAGTRDGLIGALSGAALRWEGTDGRYVALPGIRDLLGTVPVRTILATTPVAAVVDEATGSSLDADALIETTDWIRPRLLRGKPVVVAKVDARTGDGSMQTAITTRTSARLGPRSAWLADVTLALVTGLGMALAKRTLDFHLGIPGHAGMFWIAVLMTGAMLNRRPGMATLAGASVVMWSVPLGMHHSLVYNAGLYGAAGAMVDVLRFVRLPIDNLFGAIVAGALAHAAKFGYVYGAAASSGLIKHFYVVGLLPSLGMHLLFGAVGGFAAWSLIRGAQLARRR